MTSPGKAPAAQDLEVSVVMGVRNGGERIAAAVRSILAQRNVDLELIVVDDGSTDETPGILASASTSDPRVKVIRQEAAGLTAALMRGCAEARARFIARQDADEISHPDRLRRQLATFAHYPDLALVSCWTEHLAPRGERLRIVKGCCPVDVPLPIFERSADADGHRVRVVSGPTQHGSAVFPAELYRQVEGYRAAFAAAQDWDLWLRLGEHGSCLIVGDVLLSTTIDARSLSFAIRDVQMALGDCALEALECRLAGEAEDESLARAAGLSRQVVELRRERQHGHTEALGLYHIGESLRRQRHPAALFYLWRAARRNPMLLRAWVRIFQALLTPRAVGDLGQGSK